MLFYILLECIYTYTHLHIHIHTKTATPKPPRTLRRRSAQRPSPEPQTWESRVLTAGSFTGSVRVPLEGLGSSFLGLYEAG